MTYTWGAGVLPALHPSGDDDDGIAVSSEHRRVLERIADKMIPSTEEMPAASEVDVAGDQLDVVLRSRPDLAVPLTRALCLFDPDEANRGQDISAWLDDLRRDDPEAHEALVTAVLASYYLSDGVKERLGYPGQQPSPVNIGYPRYIEEGLLEAVLEQGVRYREPGSPRS